MKFIQKITGLLVWLLILIVSGLFVYSAVEHARNQPSFVVSVLKYQIVEGTAAQAISLLVPSLQLVVAAQLLLSNSKRLGFTLAAGLFFIFAIAQTSAFARNLNISCGCYGASQQQIDMISIGAVVSLSLCCFTASFYVPTPNKIEGQTNAIV